MSTSDSRLTTEQMARFVSDGYLRFDAIVPQAINERAVTEMAALAGPKIGQAIGKSGGEALSLTPHTGTPLSACYPAPSAIGEMLRHPIVSGLIQSLVGTEPLFDHDFVHVLPANSEYEQALHVDAVVDAGDPRFDIQVFYYPVEVKPGAGGTRFVPGSHLRRVHAGGLARLQHIHGELQFSGPAGTVLVFHHGMWHAGQRNPSDDPRWMYKIRLNPTQPQVRLWDTADFEEMQNDASDHVFARMRDDSVAHRFRSLHPWQGGHSGRHELMQRARLWRMLSGDAGFDVDYYLTRLAGRVA